MTYLVGLKMTQEEVDALDALGRYIGTKSRSETIREALRRVKPSLAVNPFTSKLVRSSRSEHPPRVNKRKKARA